MLVQLSAISASSSLDVELRPEKFQDAELSHRIEALQLKYEPSAPAVPHAKRQRLSHESSMLPEINRRLYKTLQRDEDEKPLCLEDVFL
jgi:hypothetical protein